MNSTTDLIERWRLYLEHLGYSKPLFDETITALSPVMPEEVEKMIAALHKWGNPMSMNAADLLERLAWAVEKKSQTIEYAIMIDGKQQTEIAKLKKHMEELEDFEKCCDQLAEEILACENNPDFSGHSFCTKAELKRIMGEK